MAALTTRLRAAFDALLSVHAQLLFSRDRWVGLLVIAAVSCEPRYVPSGLLALLGTTCAVRALGLGSGVKDTTYGYNALLVGYVIAHGYALDVTSMTLALSMGALCALVTASLGLVLSYFGWLPVLSAPFILTAWFTLGVAPHLALTGAPPALFTPSPLPPLLVQVLEGLGGCVLMPSVAAGAWLLAALLLHSRIASLLAVAASVSITLVLELAHAPVSDSLAQLITCNAALAAMALGGVWIIPSRSAWLLASFASLLSAFFTLGFAEPLQRLGLSLDFVPWNVTVFCVISALRQRVSQVQSPRLASFAAESPEQLVLADIPERALAGEPTAVPFHLPFAGVWSCTQGVDGAYTHRGSLRHAYDFEVYAEHGGSLCSGEGDAVSHYHCYGLAVLAVADGTVVATENYLPDNPIGEVSLDKPFGNQVTIQHAPGVYSVVAHLAPSTIVVYPGQYVRRGTVLGYVGNSGRSPRPHLHFQLQCEQRLGSASLPCRFVDVVVREGDQKRLEAGHVPREGEALRALEPNYTLAPYFELTHGARLIYRVGQQRERIESAVDAWGRPILRSLDRGSELVLCRTETGFACGELRGAQRSLLNWLRLCLPRVPYDRESQLRFRSVLPQRWLGGWLRGLHWDLTASFMRVPGLTLDCYIELDGEHLIVHGTSRERDARALPLLRTRAVLTRGVGPSLIEVVIAGRTARAELLSDGPPRLASEPNGHAAVQPAFGLGDWS